MEREIGKWRRWVVNGVVFGLGGVMGVLVVNNLRSMDGVDREDQVEGAGRPQGAAVPQPEVDRVDQVDGVDGVDGVDRADGVGWVDEMDHVDGVDSVELENALDGLPIVDVVGGVAGFAPDEGGFVWRQEKRPGYVGLLEAGEAPTEAGLYGRVEIVGVALVDGCLEVERRGYGRREPDSIITNEVARLGWKTVYGSHEGEVVCLGHVVGEWREEQRIPERVVWPGEGEGTKGTEGT